MCSGWAWSLHISDNRMVASAYPRVEIFNPFSILFISVQGDSRDVIRLEFIHQKGSYSGYHPISACSAKQYKDDHEIIIRVF